MLRPSVTAPGTQYRADPGKRPGAARSSPQHQHVQEREAGQCIDRPARISKFCLMELLAVTFMSRCLIRPSTCASLSGLLVVHTAGGHLRHREPAAVRGGCRYHAGWLLRCGAYRASWWAACEGVMMKKLLGSSDLRLIFILTCISLLCCTLSSSALLSPPFCCYRAS